MDRLHELARALVDDTALAAAGADADVQTALWDLATEQAVHVLLAWRIVGAAGASWSAERRAAARAALAAAAVADEIQRRDVVRTATAFAEAGVDALVLKGAAWAHLLYTDPALRPRLDADILIAPPAFDAADRVLRGLGYEPPPVHTSELVTSQRSYQRTAAQRLVVQVDLHWRVTNRLAFANALPFARVWPRRMRVDALDGAWTMGLVDALQLACVHRVAHHGDRPELLWLMDIDLLAARLSDAEWRDLVEQAERNGLIGACALGLARATEWFGTRVPPDVRTAFAAHSDETLDQTFLQAQIDPLGILASDWRATGSWSTRLRLVTAHVFPAPDYIRARYGVQRSIWLPFLYAHRAISGLSRWIAGSR
jgi:hypothetical protein